jgi:hypothetical protein
MRSGGWYRVISLLLVLFFLSPIDPLFLLAACVGMFLVLGGPSRGARLAGAALLLAAYISLAPWGGADFLIVYVSTASLAAVYSCLRLGGMSETARYLIAALAGSLATGAYLLVTGGSDLTVFEENLTRDLITAGGEGTRAGFSGLMGEDTERLRMWLEQGARAFAYLSPGFIVLMTIACLFLTTSLLRGAGKMAEKLPGETSLAGFRFEDGLVWVLIAGLLILSAPLPAGGRRLGANAALIMTTLFIVRGVGIWVSAMKARFASPLTRGGIVILLFLLIPPVTAGLAFLSGLVDIWIDLRMRK